MTYLTSFIAVLAFAMTICLMFAFVADYLEAESVAQKHRAAVLIVVFGFVAFSIAFTLWVCI